MDNPPLETTHRILVSDARDLRSIDDESVDLVVTSPPYPMIQMWDDLFSRLCPDSGQALDAQEGNKAFELMHQELDKVWRELFRVMRNGSFACINIGDATRSIGAGFRLYSNHSRIIQCIVETGFDCLPVILWRKQTNAPNKFMGSGMLPAGAYVTLEQEYILIFRKGGKKEFKTDREKSARMQSAFFWEERNTWFSDVWDFKGTKQRLFKDDVRERSAAFPFELAYRLINMYSLYGDTVLDPFAGTGTTMLSALACGRNSVGVDIEEAFAGLIMEQMDNFLPEANMLVADRIDRHDEFVRQRTREKGSPQHVNVPHGFPVMTGQETGLQLKKIAALKRLDGQSVCASYENIGTMKTTAERDNICSNLRAMDSGQTSLTF